MKPIILIILLFFSSLNLSLWAQEKQIVIPYTLADRDRVILMDAKIGALDAKINSLEANMNLKFEGIDKQLNYPAGADLQSAPLNRGFLIPIQRTRFPNKKIIRFIKKIEID